MFHCAAGKDRTGVLAAVVLALLGVDEETIIGDYALTAAAMASLVERLKQDRPEALSAMNDQPPAYLATPPEAMRRFLDHVRAEHGSMVGYVRGIGVELEVVEALHTTLLALGPPASGPADRDLARQPAAPAVSDGGGSRATMARIGEQGGDDGQRTASSGPGPALTTAPESGEARPSTSGSGTRGVVST